jgi:hypothetical protein
MVISVYLSLGFYFFGMEAKNRKVRKAVGSWTRNLENQNDFQRIVQKDRLQRQKSGCIRISHSPLCYVVETYIELEGEISPRWGLAESSQADWSNLSKEM